jgi:hypothetical protein
MANEFKVKNGLIVIGDLTTSGTITINGALAATQSWVTSQSYLTSANLSGYATQSYVTSAIAALVDSAPAALDTLNELAAALGDDANFSTTITTSIGNKVSKSGDTMTGLLTAPKLSLTATGDDYYLNLNGLTMTSIATGETIWRNLSSLRFSDVNDWDYNSWAGLKFINSTKQIVLGVAGNVFTANSPQTGTLLLDRISTVYVNNTSQTVWHSGNLTNLNQLTNGPGYITSYTETDTLATVTGRGATTTSAVTVGTSLSITGPNRTVSLTSSSNYLHIQAYAGSTNGAQLWLGNDNDPGFYVNASQHFFRGLDSSNKMYINGTSGNVGIGTISPNSKLDVRGVIESSDGTIRTVLSYTGAGGVTGTITNHHYIFYTNNGERARITTGGNVLIGTTSDSGHKLNVNGTAYIGGAATLNSSLAVAGNTSTPQITARRYFQNPDGVPTNNLGDPTVTEMALFDEQFDNKTAFYPFVYGSSILTFETYDGTTWTDITSTLTDTQKKQLFGGDNNSSIAIPYGTVQYQITINNPGPYVYLNALYNYWSANGHNTRVNIWKKHNSGSWEQHTNSTTTVASWPGHLYLPFSTIPWHPTGTLNVHYNQIRVVYTPNWNSSYPTNNINLYKFQMWGGYPASKRVIYSTDENRNVTFSNNLTASGSLISTGSFTANSSSTFAQLATFNNGISSRSATPTITLDRNSSYSWRFIVGDGGTYPTSTLNVVNNGGTAITTFLDGGNVGIGTTTPVRKLDVLGGAFFGSTSGAIEIGNSGHLGYISGHNGLAISTNHLNVGLASGEKIRITSTGDVGIGTSSPSTKLHVDGGKALVRTSSSSWGQFAVVNPVDNEVGLTWAAGGTGYPGIDSTYTRQWIAGLSPFGTGTDRWSLTNNLLGSNTAITVLVGGNIGIGTINPSTKLHVVGNAWINRPSNKVDNSSCTELPSRVEFNNAFASGQSGYVIFRYPTYNNFLISGDYDGNVGGAIPNIQLGRQSTVYMHINSSDGNIGVGTTSPLFKTTISVDITKSGDINPGTAQLSLEGATTPGKRMILGYDTNSNGFGFIKAGNYGVTWTALSLQPDGGNVGIGTVSPSTKLDVVGVITATGGNSTNWNTAYGWGNHANAGYLTSVSDVWVNTTGDTMTGTLSFAQPVGLAFANGQYIKDNSAGGLIISSGAAVNINGTSVTINTNTVWHAGNDGAGSGLDADLLDGQQGSYYQPTSSAITTSNIGSQSVSSAATWTTTRTLTIGNTGKSVNGSANVSWSLAEIGAQAAGSYLTTETNTFLGDGGNADTHPGTDRIIFTGQLSTGAPVLGMPATDNSNAILNINRHPGEYNSQLGFSSNGSMYYRSFSAAAINSTQAWRQVWDSGNLTNNSTNWNTAFGWGNHAGLYASLAHTHSAADITSGTLASARLSGSYAIDISGASSTSNTLTREDNRTISPSELSAGQLKFGFTSWANNNSSPYADFLHLRSYTDSSGGTDNLVMFKRSGIGMRIYQQTFGSTTPYADYVDVWTTANFTQTNVNNWNTAYGWGNHSSAGYLTSVTAHTQAWSTITSTPTTISGYGITNAYTDAQIQNFFNGANAISGYNKSNWDTAYSWGNHASYSYATTSYVTTQINNLIAGAPGVLDTLDELAAALGDDSNFATTVTNSIATKLPLAGGTMSGTILFVNNIGTALQGTIGDNDFWRIYANSTSTNAGYLEIATSDDGTEPIYVRQYTGVFSSLTRTATLLDGAGNTSFPGNLNIGGFLTESSSLKLKENIEISEGNLEKVVNLRPVTYNKIGSQTTELGLIAEEVAEVYPEFVQYDENGEPIGVNYSRLTAALIGAVKELTNQVQELNKKING